MGGGKLDNDLEQSRRMYRYLVYPRDHPAVL